jgi:hypothetical protein
MVNLFQLAFTGCKVFIRFSGQPESSKKIVLLSADLPNNGIKQKEGRRQIQFKWLDGYIKNSMTSTRSENYVFE